ncbi:MAG: putative hydrolase [uncultured marine phage]|uniref:Putative hydrolase n=1 Tax=uncultured marine phage TaxID=707152 RepID=A0A8D9CC76_9VIRU|nr:MAG: putative hydrolase [uncultured marine phage]
MKYLNSRDKFINERSENRLLELLLESEFQFTNEFNDILGAISGDDKGKSKEIAYIFKYLKNLNIDTPMNYIHIGDNNGTVKFINSKKADQMLGEISKDFSWGVAKNRLLSNATESKNSIKIGRLVRKIIQLYNDYRDRDDLVFTDKDIEEFVNTYKSTYDILSNVSDNFKILSGSDIADGYDCHNYWNNDKGSLGSSCMADANSELFDIYTDNDNIKLLVLTFPSEGSNSILGGGVMGRALLWDLDDGDVFMDRIYTARDSDEKLFIEYAKENGWLYKETQSYNEGPFYTPHNNYSDSENLDLTVTVNSDRHQDIEYFPYLDTFKYFYWEKGELTNTNRGNGYIYLEDTEGGWACSECDERGEIECEECYGWGHESCTNCDGGSSECSRCEGEGDEECSDCEGNGYQICDECEGTGEDETGEPCDHCGGDMEITCQGCGGRGKETCDKCDGDGREECEECEGTSKIECEECSGEGEMECDKCHGRKK